MNPMFWELLFVLVLAGVLFAMMPLLTRPDVFFAVTIDPAFRQAPQGRHAVKTYRLGSVGSSVVSLVALWLVGRSQASAPWAVLALLPQLLGTTAAFVAVRSQVLPHAAQPATTREAVVAPRYDAIPGGWALQSVPFLLLVAVAVALAMRWTDLPARIPIHWGLGGQPDGWTDRTPASVFGPIAAAGFMCGLMLAVAVGLLRARRVQASGSAAVREEKFRRLTVLVLVVAEMLIALSASQLTPLLFGRPGLLERSFTVLVGAGVVTTIVLVVLLIRLGQGGTSGQATSKGSPPVGDRTPDAAWKWGLFYINTQDPAFLVEKRFGVGYTFNFGHPIAWVLLGLLIGIPIALGLLAR
jgi:uncharacterized membrane protein